MSNLIMKKDGTPFADDTAAKMHQGKLRKQGQKTEIVEVEGGFALKAGAPTRRKSGPMRHRDSLFIEEKDKDPNYVYRVFNHDDERWSERIKTAEDHGWEAVEGMKMGEPKAVESSPIGSATQKPVGNGVTGVLMRIRKEWYEEDKQLGEDKRLEQEDQFRNAHEQEGYYKPKG